MHPNPHISTLIGIVLAAQENNTDVDIYLTNPLSPWVVKEFGAYFAPANGIPKTTFWLLADNSHYGSIAVYDHETDSTDWVKTEVKDMLSKYPEQLLKKNPTVATLIAEALQPPRKKQRRSLSRRAFLETSANTIPTFTSIRPQPIVRAEPRSPGSRQIFSSLTGTSAYMDHSELSAYEVRLSPTVSKTFSLLMTLHSGMTRSLYPISQVHLSTLSTTVASTAASPQRLQGS